MTSNLFRVMCLFAFGFFVTIPAHAEEVTQKFHGLTLNANLALAQGKSLKDGVIVVVHGMQAHNRMEIIETSQSILQEYGHSTLAINISMGIDNRKGFHSCDLPIRFDFESAAEEIHAWVQWLVIQGVNQIMLMGHSLGGTNSLVYLKRYPESAVKRLVLLAPATRGYKRLKVDYRGRFDQDLDVKLKEAKTLIDSGLGNQLMESTDFFYCPKARIAAHTFYEFYRPGGAFDQSQDMAKALKIRALVIAGTQDERQPDVIKVFSPIEGGNIQLKIIEKAGHFFRDLNLEDAMELAAEFLNDS